MKEVKTWEDTVLVVFRFHVPILICTTHAPLPRHSSPSPHELQHSRQVFLAILGYGTIFRQGWFFARWTLVSVFISFIETFQVKTWSALKCECLRLQEAEGWYVMGGRNREKNVQLEWTRKLEVTKGKQNYETGTDWKGVATYIVCAYCCCVH